MTTVPKCSFCKIHTAVLQDEAVKPEAEDAKMEDAPAAADAADADSPEAKAAEDSQTPSDTKETGSPEDVSTALP